MRVICKSNEHAQIPTNTNRRRGGENLKKDASEKRRGIATGEETIEMLFYCLSKKRRTFSNKSSSLKNGYRGKKKGESALSREKRGK